MVSRCHHVMARHRLEDQVKNAIITIKIITGTKEEGNKIDSHNRQTCRVHSFSTLCHCSHLDLFFQHIKEEPEEESFIIVGRPHQKLSRFDSGRISSSTIPLYAFSSIRASNNEGIDANSSLEALTGIAWKICKTKEDKNQARTAPCDKLLRQSRRNRIRSSTQRCVERYKQRIMK
ncbi:hypothetical protein SUGI_0678340 [Cryptomeria japonica]|nr:hypothetical protein SUGI_0678340 [Cryptomeria japonica]